MHLLDCSFLKDGPAINWTPVATMFQRPDQLQAMSLLPALAIKLRLHLILLDLSQ